MLLVCEFRHMSERVRISQQVIGDEIEFDVD